MTNSIPNSDSISELASFWDTHDVTDFDDQLEEVTEPVFQRESIVLSVPLTQEEATLLEQLAKSRGVDPVALVHEWVAGHVNPSSQ